MPPRHSGELNAKPFLLTTLPEKLQILKQIGVDNVEVLVFDKRIASISPDIFFRRTMVGAHHATNIVVGPRVAFGKNREGRLKLLRALGQQHHVRIHVVPPVASGRIQVSSRKIRALLTIGHIEQANRLLGYAYSVEGKVVHGEGRGRLLGFPTANIDVDSRKLLPHGVYWVKVLPSAARFPLESKALLKGKDALCNVGTRPTFPGDAPVVHCEIFMLRGKPNLYGKKLRVIFIRRIRAERKFPSISALKAQIERDAAKARLWATRSLQE